MRNIPGAMATKLKEQFRDDTEIYVDIPLTNIDAENSTELTWTASVPSYLSSNDPVEFNRAQYATFEEDFMRVGGNQIIAYPENTDLSGNLINLYSNIKITQEGYSGSIVPIIYSDTGEIRYMGYGEAVAPHNITVLSSPTFNINYTGTYYFKGGYAGGSSSTYYLSLRLYSGAGTLKGTYDHYGTGEIAFSASAGDYYTLVITNKVSGFVDYSYFTPMLSRVANDPFKVYIVSTDSTPRSEILGNTIGSGIGIALKFDRGQTSYNLNGLTLELTEKADLIRVSKYKNASSYETIVELRNTDTIAITEDIVEAYGIYLFIRPFSNRRARVRNIFLGRVLHFDSSSITAAEAEQYSDPKSEQLPYTELTFSIVNYDHSYDVDNPQGLYKYLNTRQRCRFSVGMNTEKADMFYLYLDGKPTVSSSAVTFIAKDALSFMDEEFNKLDYSLYQILSSQKAAVGFEALISDNYFKNDIRAVQEGTAKARYPSAPLYEKYSLKETFQGLANAAYLAFTSPDLGDLRIVDTSRNIIDPSWYENRIVGKVEAFDWKQGSPSCNKEAEIGKINFSYYDAVWSTGIAVFFTQTVSQLKTTDYVWYFADGYHPMFGLAPTYTFTSSELTLDKINIYTDRVEATILGSGSGTLEISGLRNSVVPNTVTEEKEVTPGGENLESNNPFRNAKGEATNFYNYIKNGYYFNSRPLIYSGEYMQDYSLQAGDIIKFTTPFTETNYGYIQRLHWNFLSCWGSIEIRRLNV